MRGGEAATRQAHNLEIACAIQVPATTTNLEAREATIKLQQTTIHNPMTRLQTQREVAAARTRRSWRVGTSMCAKRESLPLGNERSYVILPTTQAHDPKGGFFAD